MCYSIPKLLLGSQGTAKKMGKNVKKKNKKTTHKKKPLNSVSKWVHPHFHSLSQDIDFQNLDFCLRCRRTLPVFLISAGGRRFGCAVYLQNVQNTFCPLQNVLCVSVNNHSADLPPCENIL